MARFKDADWDLGDSHGNIGTWERVQIAVLMDIRDELKQTSRELMRLNNVLQCPNFIAVPAKLDTIIRNTRRRRKPKVAGKPKLRVVR